MAGDGDKVCLGLLLIIYDWFSAYVGLFLWMTNFVQGLCFVL